MSVDRGDHTMKGSDGNASLEFAHGSVRRSPGSSVLGLQCGFVSNFDNMLTFLYLKSSKSTMGVKGFL